MQFEIDDLRKIRLRLERLKGLPGILNQELKQCAQDVAQKARNMAPVDYHDLEKSIQVGRRGVQGAGGRFVSGVSNYDVFINLKHPVSDPDKLRNKVETVEDYAWYVHEHMGWASNPMPFMPNEERNTGPNGEERGGKFLDRALEELKASIAARMASINIKEIKTVDKIS